MPIKDVPTQSPGIGITDVVDPSLNAGVEFGKGDASALIEIKITLEPSGKVYHISARQQAVGVESCWMAAEAAAGAGRCRFVV
jgi:hypothetical protein